MKRLSLLSIFLALPLMFAPAVQAQLPNAPTPNLPANVYAFGASYDNGVSPSVAGTGMYAHLMSASTGTYGFTVLDILPVSVKPVIVTTNVGVGVAQKILTINSANLFGVVSTGLTVTGSNTGWNWTGGGLVDIPIKKAGVATKWHIQPNVRFVKANVPTGNGYQLIFGGMLALEQ